MFCHDGTTIYYPTGPGRVHMITIAALADCDGSDEDLSDSTSIGDLADLVVNVLQTGDARWFGSTPEVHVVPRSWPMVHIEENGVITDAPHLVATAADFHDVLELWADWCDRDAARLDSLEGPAPDEEAEGILERLRKAISHRPAQRAAAATLLASAEAAA